MIKNIIFDMGNVLIRFDREVFLTRLGVAQADRELLMREVFQSLEWARMDRGSLTDAQAAQSICRRLPEHLHDAAEKLVQMWDRPILPVPGMLELIQEELLTSGVANNQFISFNFEAMNNAHLCTAEALHAEIMQQAAAIDSKVYLFFDEIQEVVNWE